MADSEHTSEVEITRVSPVQTLITYFFSLAANSVASRNIAGLALVGTGLFMFHEVLTNTSKADSSLQIPILLLIVLGVGVLTAGYLFRRADGQSSPTAFRKTSKLSDAIQQSPTKEIIQSMLAAELPVQRHFASTQRRLSDEVDALGLRANVNLVIGVMTTALAVGLLFFVTLETEKLPAQKDYTSFLVAHLPRVTIAIFIEVFSFFFLRLYRATLAEIKYFQNELTNVECRYAAFEAMQTIAKEQAPSVIANLLQTERNFILKSGESTTELEKARIEGQAFKDVTNLLGSLKK